jgi:hypothetical protein
MTISQGLQAVIKQLCVISWTKILYIAQYVEQPYNVQHHVHPHLILCGSIL